MKLIIVPPEVDSTDDIRKISDGESFIFTADHLLKKELVRGKIARPDKVLTISDVADDSVFDDVNDLTRRYSREWFKAEEADEILSFRGVNLAGQLVAETSFYFIKVLRAVCISQAIRGSYGGKAEFILADDESIWAKVFKYTARKRGIGLDIRKFAPAKGSLDSGIFPIKDMIRRSAARLYGRTRRNIPSGGILYSCAPGYFKLFRDISATGGTSYYLRPEFSPRTGIEFRGKETVYLTPECFIEKEDKTICRKWLKNRDIRAVLDSHFKDSDFFVYKGDNLWEIIKHDLFHMLDQALFRGAVWVLGFNRILDSLKPRTIIVEENICPFNKTLIECADKKGIPSVYLLHGLLTYDLFSSIGSASTVVVPGTYTKKFLTDHGVAENMIAEIGLPYYEKKISSIDRTGSRRKFFSRYGLDDGKRIVMLASHDVFTEKRPYYTGNPHTPENAERMMEITCEAVRASKNTRMVIKIHPMDGNLRFIVNVLKRMKMTEDVLIVKDFDAMELIAISDLVLCGCSTVYLEALLLKVPVLVFDDVERGFLRKLGSEFVSLKDKEKSVKSINGLIEDKLLRTERLKRQEDELSWHFVDKNNGSQEKFRELLNRIAIENGGRVYEKSG